MIVVNPHNGDLIAAFITKNLSESFQCCIGKVLIYFSIREKNINEYITPTVYCFMFTLHRKTLDFSVDFEKNYRIQFL